MIGAVVLQLVALVLVTPKIVLAAPKLVALIFRLPWDGGGKLGLVGGGFLFALGFYALFACDLVFVARLGVLGSLKTLGGLRLAG